MNNNEHIEQMSDDALNSVDGIARATAKPYLLTRINARMSNTPETAWERAGRFIARPAVVVAGLCLVIGINVITITVNRSVSSVNTVAEQQAAPDEFSNTVATLYDIENNEP
jgi:hypothetical protein